MTDPASPTSRSPLRIVAVGVALLVVLVPIVVGLVLRSGGASAGTARSSASAPATAPAPASAKLFVPVVTKPVSPAPNRMLPAGRGALVADVQRTTTMRSRPGGGRVVARVLTRTAFGSGQTFWVVRLSGSWLGVISNLAGNNQVGWIPDSSASLSRVNWELKASLSARMLTVLHNGRAVLRYPIAIGAPSAPTPTGRFAVTDRLRTGDSAGPYGCCIVALSAQAPHAIENWSGGNRIAIHSTPEADSIGKAVSHGCMRLSLADGRWLLEHIPLGTPTLVTT